MKPASAVRWPGMLVLALCLAAGGCSMSGLSGGVDETLVTSNIPVPPADPGRSSDETTIRNAVSSADLGAAAAQLAWANADTGSRGTISSVVESKESGTLCRRFTTTRESFDGVGLFNGKACMVASGAWQLTAFAPN